MTYHIRAWVVDGTIATVNCNSRPIKSSILDMPGADIYDIEVEGEYTDAAVVFADMKFHNGEFSGVDVVSVEKVQNDNLSVTPDPAEVQAMRREGVDAERTRRIEQGHAFPVLGVTDPIPLQGRPLDQTVYTTLLVKAMAYQSAGVTDPVLVIRDAADVNHLLTPNQMIALVTQGMNWVQAVMQVSWDMKDGKGTFPEGIPADYTDDRHWP